MWNLSKSKNLEHRFEIKVFEIFQSIHAHFECSADASDSQQNAQCLLITAQIYQPECWIVCIRWTQSSVYCVFVFYFQWHFEIWECRMQFDKQNAHMRYHQTQNAHRTHILDTRAATKAFRNIVLFCIVANKSAYKIDVLVSQLVISMH